MPDASRLFVEVASATGLGTVPESRANRKPCDPQWSTEPAHEFERAYLARRRPLSLSMFLIAYAKFACDFFGATFSYCSQVALEPKMRPNAPESGTQEEWIQ